MLNYRPQTKFAKVMFLHLSVSHSVHRVGGGMCGCGGAWVIVGRHAWLWGGMHGCQGGMCGWGACVVGGVHGCGGHVWLWGACMVVGGMHSCGGVPGCRGMRGCRGVCMVARGHAWLPGGMCGFGVCVVSGYVWLWWVCMVAEGVCVAVGGGGGGMHGCGGCVWLPGGMCGCGGCMNVGDCVVAGGMHGCREVPVCQGACMVAGGACVVVGGVHGCRGHGCGGVGSMHGC